MDKTDYGLKRYYQYSKEELAEMDESGLEALVDIECALGKVPLLPERPIEPEKETMGPDVKLYAVGDFYFTDLETATAVVDVMSKAMDAGKLYRTEYMSVMPHNKAVQVSRGGYHCPEVKSEDAYSVQLVESREAGLQAYREKKKAFNELNDEYQKIKEQRQGYFDAVQQAHNAAAIWVSKRDRLRAEFERYLKLTEWNAQIALNLLMDVYPNLPAEFPEFLLSLQEEYDLVLSDETRQEICATLDLS